LSTAVFKVALSGKQYWVDGLDVVGVEVVGVDIVVGATVVGATDGFAVGWLGSPITHALLVCPPNEALQHSN